MDKLPHLKLKLNRIRTNINRYLTREMKVLVMHYNWFTALKDRLKDVLRMTSVTDRKLLIPRMYIKQSCFSLSCSKFRFLEQWICIIRRPHFCNLVNLTNTEKIIEIEIQKNHKNCQNFVFLKYMRMKALWKKTKQRYMSRRGSTIEQNGGKFTLMVLGSLDQTNGFGWPSAW